MSDVNVTEFDPYYSLQKHKDQIQNTGAAPIAPGLVQCAAREVFRNTGMKIFHFLCKLLDRDVIVLWCSFANKFSLTISHRFYFFQHSRFKKK